MTPSPHISRQDFERALDAQLASMRVVHFAIPAGALALLGVVAFLAFAPRAVAGEATAAPHPLGALSIVTAAMSLMAFLAGPAIAASIRRKAIATATSAPQLVQGFRQAEIVRLALLEGAALVGLVVCLLAALDGSLASKPIYWLNALPALGLFLVAAVTIPSRDRFWGQVLQ